MVFLAILGCVLIMYCKCHLWRELDDHVFIPTVNVTVYLLNVLLCIF